MDDYKMRLNASVAARLSAAPASKEKDELIEELSDNLYRRFLEMSGAGVPEEEAFNRSLDDLGDVDELLTYLGVEPNPDLKISIEPDGSGVTIQGKDGRPITVNDGGEGSQRIVINGPDGHRQTIVYGQQGQEQETDAAQAEAAREEVQPEGTTDGPGGAHSGQFSQGDLDAILAGVQEACNVAIDQAKSAIKQAKEALQRRTSVEKDKGRVSVHFNTHPNAAAQPTPPEPPEPPEPPVGWEFEAEVNTDQGRFFAGGGPKERKDVVYGFGYDKERGGFFTQWGEYQGEGKTCPGPHFTGEDSCMEHNDDNSYSVTALKDLRGIEVVTGAGDVTIHMDQAPDAGVIIDGDVDDLDVTCSADGVLTIREGRTASSSFFSRRGFSSADVELYLPRRHWELITVTTGSGDVDIGGDGLDVDQLAVKTMSGDLNAELLACGQLNFHSASGDLDLSGSCTVLHADTMSGDITLNGEVQDAFLKSASGDIELDGRTAQFRGAAVSGDVSVATDVLPAVLELSSKSGDCAARIPDAGPFSVRMKTISGELHCDFPINYVGGMCVYGGGDGPVYSITTVSGDVSLERL